MPGNNSAPKKSILVSVSQFGGLGDIFFGINLCKLLKNRYPDAKITMLTDASNMSIINNLAKNEIEGVHLLDTGILSKLDNLDKKEKLELYKNTNMIVEDGKLKQSLIIEGPVFQTISRYSHSFDPDTPLIMIPEYNAFSINIRPPQGFKNVTTIETGLSDKNDQKKGLFIHQEIAQDSDEKDPNSKQAHKADTLKNLSDVDELIKQKSPEQYLNETEISFAYYPKDLEHYDIPALALARKNKESENKKSKNVDYMVAGNINSINNRLINNKELISRIHANGFTRIEFCDLDNKTSKVISEQDGKSEKTFRILYRNKFTHNDVLNLIKLSEIIGVTGDQSLSEVLSSGGFPIYAAMYFKADLCAQLANVYAKLGNEELANIFTSLSSFTRMNDLSSYYDKIQTYCDRLSDDEVKAAVAECHRKIRETFNLGEKIIPIIDPIIQKQEAYSLPSELENINDEEKTSTSTTTILTLLNKEQNPPTPKPKSKKKSYYDLLNQHTGLADQIKQELEELKSKCTDDEIKNYVKAIILLNQEHIKPHIEFKKLLLSNPELAEDLAKGLILLYQNDLVGNDEDRINILASILSQDPYHSEDLVKTWMLLEKQIQYNGIMLILNVNDHTNNSYILPFASRYLDIQSQDNDFFMQILSKYTNMLNSSESVALSFNYILNELHVNQILDEDSLIKLTNFMNSNGKVLEEQLNDGDIDAEGVSDMFFNEHPEFNCNGSQSKTIMV